MRRYLLVFFPLLRQYCIEHINVHVTCSMRLFSDHTSDIAHAKQLFLCYRIRTELLLQCVSRTLKNILRDILRSWIKSQRSDVSEQAIRQILVQFLNLVSGAHTNSVTRINKCILVHYSFIIALTLYTFLRTSFGRKMSVAAYG